MKGLFEWGFDNPTLYLIPAFRFSINFKYKEFVTGIRFLSFYIDYSYYKD